MMTVEDLIDQLKRTPAFSTKNNPDPLVPQIADTMKDDLLDILENDILPSADIYEPVEETSCEHLETIIDNQKKVIAIKQDRIDYLEAFIIKLARGEFD